MAPKEHAEKSKKEIPNPSTPKVESGQSEQLTPSLNRVVNQARRAPRKLTPSTIKRLQRTVGNRAVSRHLPRTKASIPDNLKLKMEHSLGADFSDITISENSDAAKNLGARAITQGDDIHFAPGQYDPGSQAGEELLGHELTHVLQQKSGRVDPTTQASGRSVNESPELEAEADRLGALAARNQPAQGLARGIPLTPQSLQRGVIQRTVDYQLVDQAICAMIQARERGGPPPPAAHPSTYSDRVPEDINLALWDLYKALFWQTSYGQTPRFWMDGAIRRLRPHNEGLSNARRMPSSETEIIISDIDYVASLSEALDGLIPAERIPPEEAAERGEIPTRPAGAEPSTETATLPTSRTATEAEMLEIMQSRQEIRIVSTEHRRVEFIDPQIIGLMPVRGRQGPRNDVFGPLITLLNRKVTLEQDLIPQLESQISGLQGQLEGAGRRRARLEQQIAQKQAQLARLNQERTDLTARISAAQTSAQARAITYFEGRRNELTQRTSQLTQQLTTQTETVTRLEQSLRPQVVNFLYLDRQYINVQLLLGQGNEAELRQRLQVIERELTTLQSGLSEADQNALPQPPGAIENPTVRDLNQVRRQRNQAYQRINRLTQARARREQIQTELAAPPPDTSRIDQALRLVREGSLTIEVDQSEYEAQVQGGGRISLGAVSPGLNVDRPQGFVEGGSIRIPDERYLDAARQAFESDTQVGRAQQILGTWGTNEGRADSINTWDRARLTLGPGIASAGVLQNAFYRLYQNDPAAFHDLFERFGVSIVPPRRGSPVQFSYVVPQPRPGEPAVPSTQPPGTRVFGSEAIDYIIRDPVMLIQFRRAANNPAWQTAMVQMAVEFSIGYAFDFTVAVPNSGERVPPRVAWTALMQGLDEPIITATQAAIADNRHASGGNLQDDINDEYARIVNAHYSTIDVTAVPRQMSREHRLELARFVLQTVQPQRRNAFEQSIQGFTFASVFGE